MRPNSHLIISERTVISNMYRQNKYTQAEIARAINRDPSVISREIRRNGNASGYDPDMAQKNYHLRKLKTVYQKQFNEKIFDYFKDGLKNRISPDVIAGILKISVDKTCHVSTQTIYNWIYKERCAGLTKFLLFDNGSEMSMWRSIQEMFQIPVFFTGRPWEKPLIENANRMLRRFFPKKMQLIKCLQKRFYRLWHG